MRVVFAAGIATIAVAIACRGNTPPLYPAGSEKDEGHGLLAQASTQFLTADDDEGLADDDSRRAYGGYSYGGAAYGGSAYGSYSVPAWPAIAPNRTPKYNQVEGLTGAIEGVIAARPTKVTTSCGEVASAPVAVVYIEKVQVGRTIINEGRPSTVGGAIVKRGCALTPVVQFVTPLPAALSIHGDAKPARIRIATSQQLASTSSAQPAPTSPKVHDLEAAGRVSLQLHAGITRIDAENGSLGAAWVIAIDTPYFAVTDERGRFRIDELAAGTYDITIWQAPAPKVVNGTVMYGEPTLTKRHVRVENRRATRVDVR
jgi:hypothetical protein